MGIKLNWSKPDGVVVMVNGSDLGDGGICGYEHARSSFGEYRLPIRHLNENLGVHCSRGISTQPRVEGQGIVTASTQCLSPTFHYHHNWVGQTDKTTHEIMLFCSILFVTFRTPSF